jgi:outer membrane protein OmpA-like peptidoglycan-associated protein
MSNGKRHTAPRRRPGWPLLIPLPSRKPPRSFARACLYAALILAIAPAVRAQAQTRAPAQEPVRVALRATARASEGAQKHELDSAEAVLRARLGGLTDSGDIVVLREPQTLTVRIPARDLFDADSAHVKQGAAKDLPWAAVSELLRRQRRLVAQVEVYTDSIGGQSANQRFSEQRAQSLVAALQAAAVRPERLQAKGMGPSSELDVNDSPEGRDQNRRVEVVFALTQAAAIP